MKKILFILLVIITVISCSKEDSVIEEENNNSISEKAKVVGYLPWYRFSQNDKIEYCKITHLNICLLYTSPSPRDRNVSRMPSSA